MLFYILGVFLIFFLYTRVAPLCTFNEIDLIIQIIIIIIKGCGYICQKKLNLTVFRS
jgi:hypothetical protein